MRLYQYFIVLIFTLCLIINVLYAQADAIKLTAKHGGGICPSSQKIPASGVTEVDNALKCAVAKPYHGNFTVECVPDTALTSNLTLTWLKNSAEMKQNERIKIFNSDKNLVLEFNPIIPDDMGEYECKVVKKGENPSAIAPEKTLAIEIKVLPYVKQAHKDFTVVEENSINVTCIVFSKVPTTVTWTVKTPGTSNVAKNFTTSEGRIVLSKINDTTNAMLHIKSANLSLDRGTYDCLASSEVGFSPTIATFMIRLKGKYAALWPFIGICAEVIVLCAIILIYEKKRDKTEMEESDTDQGPETKSSPDHGQDGVRYRK